MFNVKLSVEVIETKGHSTAGVDKQHSYRNKQAKKRSRHTKMLSFAKENTKA